MFFFRKKSSDESSDAPQSDQQQGRRNHHRASPRTASRGRSAGPQRGGGGQRSRASSPSSFGAASAENAAPISSPSTPKNAASKGGEPLKAYIVGGLDEVGKNCLALEYAGDIVVVDMGLSFPSEEMLGVDFLVPDLRFLEKQQKSIRAIVVTHAHLDHIGALQHALPRLGFPKILCTRLTAGLIEKRLDEYGLLKNTTIEVVDTHTSKVRAGHFTLEFFPVKHSIPDAMGMFAHTPGGNAVHTGDFRFEFSPHDGTEASDLQRMASLAAKGVDVLFCESTNATREGNGVSEKRVMENLARLIENAKGRVIIASFSSLISRVEGIVQAAAKNGRKVFVSGRSMNQNLEIASRLGYFRAPRGSIRRLSAEVDTLPPERVLILTTGAQGEPRSALTRIGHGMHPQISIKKGDTVVLSSTPIPGNERGIAQTLNNLIRLGAEVVTNDTLDVHTSGHGYAGDIRMMHSIFRPKIIVPVHGELFMRRAHQQLALDAGWPAERVPLLENGSVVEFRSAGEGHVRRSKQKIENDLIFVDGLGTGEEGTRVQTERRIMADNGTVVLGLRKRSTSNRLVGDIEIFSRGFVYMRESRDILRQAAEAAKKAWEKDTIENPSANIPQRKAALMRAMSTFFERKTGRNPMVIPVVTEI